MTFKKLFKSQIEEKNLINHKNCQNEKYFFMIYGKSN